MKGLVVINESHQLLPEQQDILNQTFESFQIYNIPKNGLNLSEMKLAEQHLINESLNGTKIVFVSPVPALMSLLTKDMIFYSTDVVKSNSFMVFHNDNRIKKELPNGKIIMVVAKTGWQLV